MRRLTINTFMTLDGVMQAPGGPHEDPSGGFSLGGWSANYWDDAMGQRMGEAMAEGFDLLLGRRTYEIFAAHWPFVTDEPAAALNGATKYVASRTLGSEELIWGPAVLLEGDVAEAVAGLKQGDGPEIQVHGSAHLIQTLLRKGLADELRVWTFPLVVGQGKRLFADGTVPGALELVDSMTSSTGVLIATYRPAGAIDMGSLALDEPTEAEVARRQKLAAEDAAR